MHIRIGTSGWSYPSWRPGFYPPGLPTGEFLRFYAERFDTVELNATAYRLPSGDQFKRWADAVPDGFRFAPKLAFTRLDRAAAFAERVVHLGDRLGPIRVVVDGARDDGLPARIRDLFDPGTALAFDLRDAGWIGLCGSVEVDDESAEPFRYLRLRDPPHSEEDLRSLAARLVPPTYVYFRHEQAPTATVYASTLRALLAIPQGDA